MDDALYGKRDKRGDSETKQTQRIPAGFRLAGAADRLCRMGCSAIRLYSALEISLWHYRRSRCGPISRPAWRRCSNRARVDRLSPGPQHRRGIPVLWRLPPAPLHSEEAGTSFKFNGKWPSTNNSAFLFGNQNIDNIIWTFASGVPIWTAYEVLTLWAFANDSHPVRQLC